MTTSSSFLSVFPLPFFISPYKCHRVDLTGNAGISRDSKAIAASENLCGSFWLLFMVPHIATCKPHLVPICVMAGSCGFCQQHVVGYFDSPFTMKPAAMTMCRVGRSFTAANSKSSSPILSSVLRSSLNCWGIWCTFFQLAWCDWMTWIFFVTLYECIANLTPPNQRNV